MSLLCKQGPQLQMQSLTSPAKGSQVAGGVKDISLRPGEPMPVRIDQGYEMDMWPDLVEVNLTPRISLVFEKPGTLAAFTTSRGIPIAQAGMNVVQANVLLAFPQTKKPFFPSLEATNNK